MFVSIDVQYGMILERDHFYFYLEQSEWYLRWLVIVIKIFIGQCISRVGNLILDIWWELESCGENRRGGYDLFCVW